MLQLLKARSLNLKALFVQGAFAHSLRLAKRALVVVNVYARLLNVYACLLEDCIRYTASISKM